MKYGKITKSELTEYCVQKNKTNEIWTSMKKNGWINENNELTFLSDELEAGIIDDIEAENDRLSNLFYSRYCCVLQIDEILEILI